MKKSLSILAVLAVACAAVAVQAAGIDVQALPPEVLLGLAGLGAAGTTKAYQDGHIIDWVNGTGAAVASNDVVVMGNILGVAMVDIANGATGSVCIDGVFTVPKVAGAVIAQGGSLTWDVSAVAFDDNAAVPAAGDVTGPPAVAFEAGINGQTTLKVRFTGVPGTVTP